MTAAILRHVFRQAWGFPAAHSWRASSPLVSDLWMRQMPDSWCNADVESLNGIASAFPRPMRYAPEPYQANTRKARSVFQRLGRPTPSFTATAIVPGC